LAIVQLYKALGGGWDMDQSLRATAVISPPDMKR
jgi:outer membrane protein TolC